MLISVPRNNYYESDTKQIVKMSQEKTSQLVKKIDESGFGARLREAFNGAKNVEISRKLGITEAAVNNYVKGRIPPADTLLAIKTLTSCSIDWLLTGDGSKPEHSTPHLVEPVKIEKELQEQSFIEVFNKILSRLNTVEKEVATLKKQQSSETLIEMADRLETDVETIVRVAGGDTAGIQPSLAIAIREALKAQKSPASERPGDKRMNGNK